MARFFNTAGVCEPRKHYMLGAIERLPGVVPLIDKESYFVVHDVCPDERHPPRAKGDRGSIIRFQNCGRCLRIPVLTSMILGADQRYVFVTT